MPHDAYAQSVDLWNQPTDWYSEYEPEYLRLQKLHKKPADTITNMVKAIGAPPDSSFDDPEAGLDIAPAVVTEPTSPAFQGIVGAAALPPDLVAQAQQPAPVYGPAPPPAAAVPPAEVFQYVDRKGVLRTFNNQYDLNTHREADEVAAAAEEAQRLIDEKGTGGADIGEVVTGKGMEGFSAFNPFTQKLEYFATQANANAAKTAWENKQAEIDKAKATPQTFQAFNAVTNEWYGAFPTQADANAATAEWTEQKQVIDDRKRQEQQAIIPIAPTGAIDQVLELGTGEEPMAAWEDWSTAFGAYSPEQQYNALMRQQLPEYGIPGYGAMAQQQFAPTFGRFLMSGYGDDAASYGLGAGQGFENWFGGQMGRRPDVTNGTGKMPWDYGTAYPTTTSTTPANLGAGWQLAQQFGALQPESAAWDQLMGKNFGMGYAMTQPDAIQAMAQSQYYGGGGPVGGYAGRAVASGLSGLYDRWMQRQLAGSGAAPAAFLPYLSSLDPNRWAKMTTPYSYVEPTGTTTSGTGVIT